MIHDSKSLKLTQHFTQLYQKELVERYEAVLNMLMEVTDQQQQSHPRSPLCTSTQKHAQTSL